MFSKIWYINCILAGLVLVCSMSIWGVWGSEIEIIPENRADATGERIPLKIDIADNRLMPSSAYDIIVDNNLFTPDRMAHLPDPEMTDAGGDDIRISGEKVVLHGVIIADDYKTAMINNPESEKDGKAYRWVKEGERIGNLRVIQVEKDKILLADGAVKYKVLLYDNKKQKKSKTSSKPKTQLKPHAQPKPQVISTEKSKPDRVQKKTPIKQQEEVITISPDGKYEIINTPFGRMKRKRR